MPGRADADIEHDGRGIAGWLPRVGVQALREQHAVPHVKQYVAHDLAVTGRRSEVSFLAVLDQPQHAPAIVQRRDIDERVARTDGHRKRVRTISRPERRGVGHGAVQQTTNHAAGVG